jgi:hypothetical protein
MKFVGTALIEIEMDVPNLTVAKLKWEQELRGNYNGVTKRCLVGPDFSENISLQEGVGE